MYITVSSANIRLKIKKIFVPYRITPASMPPDRLTRGTDAIMCFSIPSLLKLRPRAALTNKFTFRDQWSSSDLIPSPCLLSPYLETPCWKRRAEILLMLSREITVIDVRKTHQRSMIRCIFLSFLLKRWVFHISLSFFRVIFKHERDLLSMTACAVWTSKIIKTQFSDEYMF